MSAAPQLNARKSVCSRCHRGYEHEGEPSSWYLCPDCTAKSINGVIARAVPSRYTWVIEEDAEDLDGENPLLVARVRDGEARLNARFWAIYAPEHGAHDRAIFVGPAGAGKTVLACLAGALRARFEGETSRYQQVDEETFAFVAAFQLTRRGCPLGDEAPAIELALAAETLILDDLGQEAEDQFSAVIEVLHHRHETLATTIVTTALSPAKIAKRYGGGLERRLFEDACVINVKPGSRCKP